MFLLVATVARLTLDFRKKNLLTPYVYIAELLLLFATLTAQRPTHNDKTSFNYAELVDHSVSRGGEPTMWKESATRASEWTA